MHALATDGMCMSRHLSDYLVVYSCDYSSSNSHASCKDPDEMLLQQHCLGKGNSKQENSIEVAFPSRLLRFACKVDEQPTEGD